MRTIEEDELENNILIGFGPDIDFDRLAFINHTKINVCSEIHGIYFDYSKNLCWSGLFRSGYIFGFLDLSVVAFDLLSPTFTVNRMYNNIIVKK